jgi:hypothetical protein
LRIVQIKLGQAGGARDDHRKSPYDDQLENGIEHKALPLAGVDQRSRIIFAHYDERNRKNQEENSGIKKMSNDKTQSSNELNK